MAKETPGTRQPEKRPTRAAEPHADHPHQLYCRCGTPMHPNHLEKHRGMMLERYSCPNRRWWNAFWHPYTWMEPRDHVPS